jgi:hypothetical protein
MGLLSGWSARAKMALDGQVPEDRRREDPFSNGASLAAGMRVTGDDEMSTSKMSWETICHSAEFRGRWVALDDCRYDEETGRAMEGSVVDVDDDLVELCARIRESEWKHCAILFCSEDGEQKPQAH